MADDDRLLMRKMIKTGQKKKSKLKKQYGRFFSQLSTISKKSVSPDQLLSLELSHMDLKADPDLLFEKPEEVPPFVLITLSNTKLSSMTIQHLSGWISGQSSLTDLNLSHNRLSGKEIKNLSCALEKSTSLKTLNLASNRISSEDISFLANALTKNQSIRNLNLAGNKIDEEGVFMLAGALSSNTTLVELNLSETTITERAAAGLADMLSKNTALELLKLANTKMLDTEFQILLTGLKRNTALKLLNVSNNKITDASSDLFSEILGMNLPLQEVNLLGNLLTDVAAKSISIQLPKNTQLRHLIVSNCKISENGYFDLYCGMLSNSNVESLGPDSGELVCQLVRAQRQQQKTIGREWRELNSKQMKIFSKVLETSPPFETLELESKTQFKKVEQLVLALQKNSVVKCLSLYSTAINPTISRHIANLLEVPTTLTTLILRRTNLLRSDPSKIFQALMYQNKTLTKLDVSHNNLDTHASFISGILERHPTLRCLNYEFNSLANQELQEFCKGLAMNRSLKHLNLNNTWLQGIKPLVLAIESRKVPLETIQLANCQMDMNDASKLIQLGAHSLNYTKFWGYRFSPISGLLSAIETASCLTKLIFETPSFPNIQLLLRALAQNNSIKTLNLSGTNIPSKIEVTEEVCNLVKNPTLTDLDLSWVLSNFWPEKSVVAFLEAAASNKNLKKLKLRNSVHLFPILNISDLIRNSRLTYLSIQQKPFTPEELRFFFETFSVHSTLRSLELPELPAFCPPMPLSTPDSLLKVDHILKALEHNFTLEELTFGGHHESKFDQLIKNNQQRKREIFITLLLARERDPESPFFKYTMPIDIFQEILAFAGFSQFKPIFSNKH